MTDRNAEMYDKKTLLMKRERQLYGAGLEVQYNREEEKKKPVKEELPVIESYNPVTNPIPFVYKNPNVLRMLQAGK